MVPRHNRVFCGQETTWPRDTGFDNKWYSRSHQPQRQKYYSFGKSHWQEDGTNHISSYAAVE